MHASYFSDSGRHVLFTSFHFNICLSFSKSHCCRLDAGFRQLRMVGFAFLACEAVGRGEWSALRFLGPTNLGSRPLPISVTWKLRSKFLETEAGVPVKVLH